MKLLGLYDSPYVRRVAIALSCYDMPFVHESLSVFRHVPDMRAQNPLLRVPMLTLADGTRLHESAFILDALDDMARAAGRAALIPASGPRRRQVLQATALAQAATDKAVAIVYEFRRPAELRWPEWLGRLREQMSAGWALLEAELAGDYLVGDALTHADIMAVCGVGFIRLAIPEEWPAGRWPRLEALAVRLEATAPFRAIPIDGE